MKKKHKKSKNDKAGQLEKIILATGLITLIDKFIDLIERIINLF